MRQIPLPGFPEGAERINDALGRTFFVVSKAVTAGLGDTLLNDIVPD